MRSSHAWERKTDLAFLQETQSSFPPPWRAACCCHPWIFFGLYPFPLSLYKDPVLDSPATLEVHIFIIFSLSSVLEAVLKMVFGGTRSAYTDPAGEKC